MLKPSTATAIAVIHCCGAFFLGMSKTKKEIENCLISELRNMISDIECGRLGKEEAFDYFKNFMMDAEVDSKITVNVLENDSFGELGKNEARNIKVYEGW